MTKFGEIYVITNTETKMQYVGQTIVGHKKRWVQHLAEASRDRAKAGRLHASMKFHGVDKFEIKLLETVPVELLDEAEVKWIANLCCMNPLGFNLTSGGNARKVYSKESREKTSASLIGRKRPPEVAAKVSAALRSVGHRPTDEQLSALHAKNTGKKRTPEQRLRISESRVSKFIEGPDDTPYKKYQREWRRAKTQKRIAAAMGAK